MDTTGDVILYRNASTMLRLQVPAHIEDKHGIGTISFTVTFHAGSAPTQKFKRWLPYKLDAALQRTALKRATTTGSPLQRGDLVADEYSGVMLHSPQ